MKLRSTFRFLVALGVGAALMAVPAAAKSTHSNVGAASVYGLHKNFTLVGHTDLGRRGMNSPIAVAGRCAYIGDRYYSASADEPVRHNGGVAIVDIAKPARPKQVGRIAPVGLSTQRELR